MAASLRICYFGHNRRDTAFVRRVSSLLDAGTVVSTFTYRRDGEPESPGPSWDNVDLGHVEHAKFSRRIAAYFRALRAVLRNRNRLHEADVVYARNLDIFLFAWLATRLTSGLRPARARFVYECLDVHEKLTGPGIVSAALRWAERHILRKADLLVVSSPGFISNYFVPVQHYTGPHIWVENKLYFGDETVERVSKSDEERRTPISNGEARLKLGWVGIIRCQRTLDLLKALATAEPGRVTIRIAGLVSHFLIDDFDGQIASFDNIEFAGPYDWPGGLGRVYRDIDLVWAQELSWSGYNSDWLIPNRVYEASYFGVPSLSIGDTQTSHIVSERQLGFVLADDSPEVLIEFIHNLDRDELRGLRTNLLKRPDSDFVTSSRDTAALIAAIRDPRTSGSPR